MNLKAGEGEGVVVGSWKRGKGVEYFNGELSLDKKGEYWLKSYQIRLA